MLENNNQREPENLPPTVECYSTSVMYVFEHVQVKISKQKLPGSPYRCSRASTLLGVSQNSDRAENSAFSSCRDEEIKF